MQLSRLVKQVWKLYVRKDQLKVWGTSWSCCLQGEFLLVLRSISTDLKAFQLFEWGLPRLSMIISLIYNKLIVDFMMSTKSLHSNTLISAWLNRDNSLAKLTHTNDHDSPNIVNLAPRNISLVIVNFQIDTQKCHASV